MRKACLNLRILERRSKLTHQIKFKFTNVTKMGVLSQENNARPLVSYYSNFFVKGPFSNANVLLLTGFTFLIIYTVKVIRIIQVILD